jgi:hypothetical protein
MNTVLLTALLMLATQHATQQPCADREVVKNAAQEVPFIAVGRVIRKDPWRIPYQDPVPIFFQNVYFEVDEVLKGEIKSREIVVAYSVGGLIASSGEPLPGRTREGARLSDDAFRKGDRMLLLLVNDWLGVRVSEANNKRETFLDEAMMCGPVKADDNNIGIIKEALQRRSH